MNDSVFQSRLISSQDIDGHGVFSEVGHEKIGMIHHLMIDKTTGTIAYADVSFGGILGIGEEHQMVPWHALTYHPELDGFTTAITESQVKAAPRRTMTEAFDPTWEQRLHEHYRVRGYWS